MLYIYYGKYIDLPEVLPDCYNLGITSEDHASGKMIRLSEAQTAFYQKHPFSSPDEVINMSIDINSLKTLRIQEICEYDKSDCVNSFILNGQTLWLDRNTRMSLLNTANILQDSGQSDITIWTDESNPQSLVMRISRLKQLLFALELYAKACYDVTSSHKKTIFNLSTVEEIKAYDITADYPDKLNYTI